MSPVSELRFVPQSSVAQGSANTLPRLSPAIARLTAAAEPERKLGPFVLVEQLGRGGFAPVWLAREVYGETALRTAAVKLFALPQGGTASAAGERARIVAEASALCRVEHPNVVRFYALPIDETESVMGLAMEHVGGTPLDRRLRQSGPLDSAEVLAIGAAVASALAAVHRVGLVHRDVKPSNIVEAAGVYKLIDFGIAGAHTDLEAESGSESGDAEQTQRVGVLAGTMGYIDPECVARWQPADAQSDLYSLGATLFACLTLKLPASGEEELRSDILRGQARAPKLTDLAPGTVPALCELIDAMLAPSRAARPPSAEWVAIRIEQIRRELSGRARRLPGESVGPFRGLLRFESEDREVYFGRSGEVAAALETLRGRGVVALLGPSGSGKSSLARAGLLPAIAEGALGDRPAAWDIAVAAPGGDARVSVLQALAAYVPEALELAPGALIARLAERVHASDRGTLLFVDQLEELGTVSEADSVAYVVELLRELAERPLVGVRAVVAVRRDLLDSLLALSNLGNVVLRGSVLVEPLTDSVWGEVLDRALAAYGYAFEDVELRSEVLTELAQTSDAMPLVQFALTELWRRRDVRRRRLTRVGVDSIGGIAGALEKHADSTVARVVADIGVPESTVRSLLLSLTTSSGTRATRTREELERIAGPHAWRVANTLESERLIVQQAAGLTLAHEALISNWKLLNGWLAEEREQRLFAEGLERSAQLWRQDPLHAPLWRGLRVENGERLVAQASIALSLEALSFLAASRHAERRRHMFFAGVASALVLTVATIVAAYLHAVRSEQAKTSAALVEEQQTRRLAEQRTHEVEAAQGRIDQLLKDLADSPKKEEVLALQSSIRAASSAFKPPAHPQPSPILSTRVPAPPVPLAAPSATATSIKVQREW
ncbi:MAG TPA: serine/threonine-protein kinase [Polyangiaceae bacterium]|jgi:serine/threonine protein kinase|nr:serine/threonine-protein kinase [Polyangiaceae bacterium]